MDELEFEGVVKALIDQAADYVGDIEDDRVTLTNVYNGEKYGDEVDGRSQIVTREARDTIRQVMPSIMRVLTGAEQPCIFHPSRPGDEGYAQQATDYVRHIFENDNDGYRETWNAVEDALVRKTGVFKVWHEDTTTTESVSWTGLSADEYAAIEADPNITLEDVTEYDDGTYDVSGLRIEDDGRIRLAAVPPEEYLIIDARSSGESPLRGHRRVVTYSDLREMGYSEDELDDGIDWGSEDGGNEQSRQARDQYADHDEDDSADPSQRKTEYVEAYIRADFDGDGIAELRRVCTAGSGRKILENDVADEINLIDFTAWPVAHSVTGESMVELLEDLQKINTNVMRNTLNSLAAATNPDLGVVEGMVNLDDVMAPGFGKIIRMKNPEAMRELTYRFVGGDTLPMMDKLDRMKESRTGITAASQGLDAKSLQSTTASAVDATQRAALGQVELLSRNIIETGFLPLYRLILKMVVRHQDKPRAVQISGDWQTVDPRYWDADMRVRPSQALGAGSEEQRVASLMQVLAKQEQIIQVGGLENNPLITAENYYNTLKDLTVLSGFRAPERYFRDPATFQPPEPQPPQPDADMIKAQAHVQKIQADIQEQQARLQLDREKLQLDMQKARETDARLRDMSMAKLMLDMIKFQEEQDGKVDTRMMEWMLRREEGAENRDSQERLEILRQHFNGQRAQMQNTGANNDQAPNDQ